MEITGTTYYVSQNGCDKEGTDISSPMSLETAMKKVYKDGDCVLLKCGDSFLGPVNFKTDVKNHNSKHRVKISSYGEGKLPKIHASFKVSNPEAFRLVEKNHYIADFRKRESDTVQINNIGHFRDLNGNKYCSSKDFITDLKNNFDYYFDNEVLHICCDDNPVNKLGELLIIYRECIFLLDSDTEVCNLNICDTGGIGVMKSGSICENIYLHHNVIDECGGSVLYFKKDEPSVRYGNGIEFYNGGTKNILIEDNIVRNSYDVAFTMQGHIASFENVIVRNNVFVKNNQSSEIWSLDDNSSVKGYEYYGNLSFATGRGWGHTTRPDGKAIL